jgi:hypothetical protein
MKAPDKKEADLPEAASMEKQARWLKDLIDTESYPEGHPMAFEDEHTGMRLVTSRLDVSQQIEGGRSMPALFCNRTELDAWAQHEGLSVERLFKRSDNAVRVRGGMLVFMQGRPVASPVDLVWAHKSWTGYRKGMNRRATDSGEPALQSLLHVDHVVPRSRLGNLPDAWVLLIEVPHHANVGFGSRIERYLAPFPRHLRRYNLGGIEIFKLFCETMPGPLTGTLEDAFARVRHQFLRNSPHVAWRLREMEEDVTALFELGANACPTSTGATLRAGSFDAWWDHGEH